MLFDSRISHGINRNTVNTKVKSLIFIIINYLSFALVYNLHIIKWLFTSFVLLYGDNQFANVPFSDFMLRGRFFCGIKNDCQFHCYLTLLFNFQPNNTFAIIKI